MNASDANVKSGKITIVNGKSINRVSLEQETPGVLVKETKDQLLISFEAGAGEEKSLVDLFAIAGYKNPPAGAGECAGPKLLQYAFQHQLKPLAIAEFWWGLSPKSEQWKHKQFYACCKEKCEPILAHMLEGI